MLTSMNFMNVSNNVLFHLFNKLTLKCYSEKNITHSNILEENYNEGELWCPRTFDGFCCWDETPASTTAYQNCPGYIVGFEPKRFAYKRCTDNGTWYIPPNSKKPWTNYTSCVDLEDLNFRTLVNNIYVVGYIISMAALVLSIMIFAYFRTLHCTRIRIHMHLFTSFTFNNITWIIWYRTVVNQAIVVQENRIWCQLLHIVTNYFMVTSYIWMFCESLHLLLALVIVFVKEELAMRWFYSLGWGFSMLLVSAYAVVRYNKGDTARCWMDQSDTFSIIIYPIGISLFVSFLILLKVLFILLTKLRPAPTRCAAIAAKKATKAALILIPLFGLHFVIIPLRPIHDAPGEKAYQIVSALLTSLQGLCLAILYCFTNHDVIMAFRKQVSRYNRRNEMIPLTGITGGDSMINTRDHIV